MGELRGKNMGFHNSGFVLSLDGEQQVPALPGSGNGGGFVSVNRDGNSAITKISFDSLSSNANSLLFQEGPPGTNGPWWFYSSNVPAANAGLVSEIWDLQHPVYPFSSQPYQLLLQNLLYANLTSGNHSQLSLIHI